jgi:hypothetical protein
LLQKVEVAGQLAAKLAALKHKLLGGNKPLPPKLLSPRKIGVPTISGVAGRQ